MKQHFFAALIILVTTLQLDSQIITDGLVAYYPMDGNIEDLSQFQNDGFAAPGVSADINRHNSSSSSMFFDGIDGFVHIDNRSQIDLTEAISISFWIRPFQFSNDWRALVNKWRTGIATPGGEILEMRGGYYTGINPTGNTIRWNNGHVTIDGKSLELLQWTHILVTYDGNKMNLYQNGELDISRNSSLPMMSNPDIGIRFGSQTDISIEEPSKFSGNIDDVLIYNRALTENEVASIYSNDLTHVNSTENFDYRIYPNPSTDILFVELENPANYTLALF